MLHYAITYVILYVKIFIDLTTLQGVDNMANPIEIGKRIKLARELKGMTQEQLGKEVGMNKSTIQRYETGQVSKIKLPVVESLAKSLSVNPDWLIEKSDIMNNFGTQNLSDIKNIIPMPKMKKVPLIGTIACGEPILAQENIEDYVNMPTNLDGTFALRCKGDSMINARILDGDIAFIREQPEVENGEIAAVLIDNEATLKRVYYYPEKSMLILKPENNKYQDFIYINEELNDIRIIGKAVAFLSTVK